MPKTHLDRMGWISDSRFRISEIRCYFYEKVQAARDFIYRAGNAVAGVRVNDLLKSTSSVPTIVSDIPLCKQLHRSIAHDTE